MLKSLLSLFLQENCPLCQRTADQILCSYCQRQLQNYQLPNPGQFWQGSLPLFVWGSYGGTLKRAIAEFKYNNHPQLGELMGEWLAKSWLDAAIRKPAKKLTVVPIPLHISKLKQRGFNQAEIIAKSFCRFTGYTLAANGLVRVRDTKAMFGLTPEQRSKNLKNALALGKNLEKNKTRSPVLIIDDIYTTGTTTKEAAQVLQQGGISLAGVAAIATSKEK